MSNRKRTIEVQPPKPPRVSSVVRCDCPRCNQGIPAQHVQRTAVAERPGYEATLQRVRAWCEGCDVLFEVVCTLSLGQLQPVGDVKVVDDAGERAAFFAATARERGELQVA